MYDAGNLRVVRRMEGRGALGGLGERLRLAGENAPGDAIAHKRDRHVDVVLEVDDGAWPVRVWIRPAGALEADAVCQHVRHAFIRTRMRGVTPILPP